MTGIAERAMKIEPCSHYGEGDYGTRCKSGFVQSNACAGVGVVSLRDYPCCKEELCGRIYADHGGKPLLTEPAHAPEPPPAVR